MWRYSTVILRSHENNFCAQENKIMTIQQFDISAPFREYHIRTQCMFADTLFTLFTLCFERENLSAYIHCVRMWYTRNGTIGWRGGDKLLNKVIILLVFSHKKYSRSFVKLLLNRWCHMDYFNDVLTRDGSRFSNIRLVDLFIEYRIGCAIICV